MAKTKVGINGYGTIGRRVADAILKQPDMELVGVTKATPDYRMDEAAHKGIRVFAIGDARPFGEAGYFVDGNVHDLLAQCDVIVDCSPKHKGKENLLLYNAYPKLKAIFQGGEKHELTGFSFNSDCNYEQAAGRKNIRVVSCNTTALCRLISTLGSTFRIRKVRAAIARRTADQSESEECLMNAWQPDMSYPSHHAVDVKTVMPNVNITSLAGIAPMTLMHGHMLFLELEQGHKAVDVAEIIETLQQNPRILICSSRKGITTTAKLKDVFALNGRNGNVYEVCVWKESIGVDSEGEIGLHMAIDQQADAVPENIDAIRAIFGSVDRQASVAMTNQALGIVNSAEVPLAFDRSSVAKAADGKVY